MQNIDHIRKAVTILESRLSKEDACEDGDVFEPSAKCLYYYLLGDGYFKLYTFYNNSNENETINKKNSNNYGNQALTILEQGMKVAGDVLEVQDSKFINHYTMAANTKRNIDCIGTRLLLIYLYCQVLCEVQQSHMKAKLIAEHAFHAATAHTNVIDIQSNMVLQNLRDHFMTYVISLPMIASSDVANAGNNDDLTAEVEKLFKRKKSVKFKPLDDLKNQREMTINAYNSSSKLLELARNVRRLVALPVPVLLETISSAANLLKALDRIFRVYVRGNALPGQLSGGNTVEMAGNILSFRTFVLHGPYLSYKGFVSFLLDFSIAQLPASNTKLGKSFYKMFHCKDESDFMDGDKLNGPEALVSFIEASIIFIESSSSTTPVLVLNKFIKLYEELGGAMDFDPWTKIFAWTTTTPANDFWNIDVGVNFMQFVDCIGKLGAVGYSSAVFNEMLPTVSDKIEHFLSAFLGLTDSRKWATKVDNKLKKSKEIIQKLSHDKRIKPSPQQSQETTAEKA